MGEHQRLTRSLTDRALGGVCGGMAAYTGINALWLRLLFLILAPTTNGFGILLYLVLWLALPVETLDDLPPLTPVEPGKEPDPQQSATPSRGTSAGQLAFGLVAALVGVALLVVNSDLLSVAADDLLWPVAALSVGGALLWRQFRGV